jgi:hypothetical protein
MFSTLRNLLFLVIVGSFCGLAQEQPPLPLQVLPLSWDFGTIKDDKPVSYIFTIKNDSTETVELTALPAPCDCMVSMPVPSTVESGGEAKLHVLFHPKGRWGSFRWEVSLKTSLAAQPKITIPLSTFILRDAMLSEEIVNFGVFKRGVPKKHTIWLTCRQYPGFALKEAQVTAEGFGIAFAETTVSGFYPGDQRGYRIDITPREDIGYGRRNGNVVLTTTIAGHEKMELRLFAYINGEITAAPDYIPFGLVKPGMVQQKNIKVSHNDFQQFSILRLNSTIPFITPQLKTVIPRKYYEIELILKCPQDAASGEFRGKLEIFTDCAKHSLLEVFLQGFIQGSPLPDKEQKKTGTNDQKTEKQ